MSIKATAVPIETEQRDVPLIGYQLPHSDEAEQSVLGGIMLDNHAYDDVVDRVDAGMFYRHQHRLIFVAMSTLAGRQSPIDVVTVSEVLEQAGQFEDCGGLAYLAKIARETPSATNVIAYADIVRDRYQLRQLSQTAVDVSRQALDPKGRSAHELIESAEHRLYQLVEGKSHALNTVTEILSSVVDAIDVASQTDGGITGVPTGYVDLDDMTAGLQPADLIVIAGRPSMGKTTLGMNIVEHVLVSNATAAQGPVFVFSLEMPSEQLMMRLLASTGRLPLQALRRGQLEDEDWPKLSAAVVRAKEWEGRLFIDDESGISASTLKARARRLARRHGRPALILVDYLQLLQEPGNENRNIEISTISRILKETGKELRAPVIALSQLNRQLETRPNKRPCMADLRDSGAIEQDADVIAFVYRDEIYHPDNPDNHGLAELIIGKQRNGPVGTVNLAFLGKSTRFESMEWKRTEVSS